MQPTEAPTSPSFSVVIPAHDEEHVLGRCLAFVERLAPDEAEVVVVANGCTDGTADVARRAGVHVIDLPDAGKVGALNAGEAVVRAFPRVFLDADVTMDVETLRRLVEVLRDGSPAVGAPRPVFDVEGRPALVRLFYRAWTELPYLTDNMVGSGVYALNEAGRARFGAFPNVTGDDLFVQRWFSADETRVLSDGTFRVQTPWDLRSLIAIRTRVARGNAELAGTGKVALRRSTKDTLRGMSGVLRRQPSLLPACAVYVWVTIVSRIAARRRSAATWQRDATNRQPDRAKAADGRTRGPAPADQP